LFEKWPIMSPPTGTNPIKGSRKCVGNRVITSTNTMAWVALDRTLRLLGPQPAWELA